MLSIVNGYSCRAEGLNGAEGLDSPPQFPTAQPNSYPQAVHKLWTAGNAVGRGAGQDTPH